jgi:GDP-L-fucose synthase
MNYESKIFIAGHKGMVGSAIMRKLLAQGYKNIVYRPSRELDLRNQNLVNLFFEVEKPEYVILAAAKVGGIHSNNTYRADFIYDNIMIQSNVIHASYLNNVKKLLFLGSSCIYPKLAPQPLKEEYLLSGHLEKTNQPYAIAKIAGIEMCDDYRAQYGCNFISAMPTNLYGPNDNYDLEHSHVLPAMLRKFITAKRENSPEIELWGTGSPRREFLHVDDLAEACLHLMHNYNEQGLVNIGTGEDISIKELSDLISSIAKFNGQIRWNTDKPDGTPRKLMNVSKINSLGWQARIDLKSGLKQVYELVNNTSWD